LAPGEAGEVVQLVAQHQTQTFAEAGDGWPPGEGLRLGLVGRLDDGQLAIAAHPSIGGKQGAVDFDTLLHGGSRAPCCDARSVRGVRQRLPEFRQSVLAGGMRDGREELGAFPGQRSAAPEEVPSRPQRSRIDVGLGEQAATEQDGNRVRVERVVLGFAPMHGFHGQGMAEDNSAPMWSAEGREPGPGNHALDRHNAILTRGRQSLEKRLWASGHVAVQHELPVRMQDADIHGAGMPVDATVKVVWLRVKAPEVSSSVGC
jgi:hypothetical protein